MDDDAFAYIDVMPTFVRLVARAEEVEAGSAGLLAVHDEVQTLPVETVRLLLTLSLGVMAKMSRATETPAPSA